MQVIKKSEIKDEFTAKGMTAAKQVLRYENMGRDEQISYNIHVKNKRIEMSVTETALDKGKRQAAIEFAKKSLKIGISITDLLQITSLSEDEILILSQGGELDKED